VLKPVDNLLVGCGEGTTILKKNLKKINLGKNIFWKHVSAPGLGIHIFHCVLSKLRRIERIGGVQVNEGQQLLHE
jgi:hypothetical protein